MKTDTLKSILDKPIPDIEVVQKLISEKNAEDNRHLNIVKNLNEKLKSKYVTNILCMMWEILTKVNEEKILNPIDENGDYVEHTSGRYLITDTLDFSENGLYVKIQDSWSNIWVYPTEMFKYPKNFKKRKSIYYKFLKQRSLIEWPKKITDLEKSVKMYESYIKSYNKQIESLRKQFLEIKSNPNLTPLNIDDLGFNSTDNRNE